MEALLDFSDVRICPSDSSKFQSRSEVGDMLFDFNYGNGKVLSSTGIIAANMDGVGTFEVARVLNSYGCLTALHKHYPASDLIEFFNTDDSARSFYSMGINVADLSKLKIVRSALGDRLDKICVDVANGHMQALPEFVTALRSMMPDALIMVGNVVTPGALANLLSAGADVVKVGIGSGSVCTTRLVAGVGYPQLSAVLNCKTAARSNTNICSDGGCTNSGDVAVAMVAGAGFVMLGGMLAGTDEGGGERDGNGNITFYGMSSKTAQDIHNGGLKEYRSSEGRTVSIPYKGGMDSVITHILGGLRSAATYIGDYPKNFHLYTPRLVRVNNTHNRVFEHRTTGV